MKNYIVKLNYAYIYGYNTLTSQRVSAKVFKGNDFYDLCQSVKLGSGHDIYNNRKGVRIYDCETNEEVFLDYTVIYNDTVRFKDSDNKEVYRVAVRTMVDGVCCVKLNGYCDDTPVPVTDIERAL